MEKISLLSQGSDHGVEDNEDLLTLSLSTGPKLSAAVPTPPTSSPLGQQILQSTCLPLTPAAPLSPQTSIFQQFLPIPQALLLPSYSSNYQSHSPSGLNLNDNTVSQEIVSHSSRPSRSCRNPFQTPRQRKTETIPPPFPWATTQRAMIHSLDFILSHNMTTISGEVQCKICNNRAPYAWINTSLPTCQLCGRCHNGIVKALQIWKIDEEETF